MIVRYLTKNITADLKDKIVFIGGPRQVGKTTLAEFIGKKYFKNFSYFNWDYQPDRKEIINYRFPTKSNLLIFDELHKYKLWKNFVKGIYDKYKKKFKIMVTGSAKMDIYRWGGDSLLGRYFYYLLHPLSLGEVLKIKNDLKPNKELNFKNNQQSKKTLDLLLQLGGFPEPFLKQNLQFWRRWQSQRIDRLVKEEIRELTKINDLSRLQVLVEILPTKVGSLLSLNTLREDFQVAYKTIASDLNILERFYFHFRIYAFTGSKIKSIKKMSKLYLWDWSVIEDQGKKIENLVASHLLKTCHFLHQGYGYKVELYYLRDLEGREIDFLITSNQTPWFAVEVKQETTEISSSLFYFKKKLKIPYLYQVTTKKDIDYYQKEVRVISLDKFLTGLI